MKKLLVLVFIALIPLSLQASRRVMLYEDFTATWCQYCPSAARGIEELDTTAVDSIVCIAYHPSTSDPYYNASAATRSSYYGITGYPTVQMDGDSNVVGGLSGNGNMYSYYREFFNKREPVPSPLQSEVSTTYDSSSRAGEVTAVLTNTTDSAVTAQLQVVVTENHIYYVWEGMDSLQYVEREMLPSASGQSVTIPANDSLVKTIDFTLSSGWVAGNCDIIVFVQNNSTKWLQQGSHTGPITPTLGVAERPNPSALRLSPVRNPVTGPTFISYQLPTGVRASLAIYDGQGRLVRNLSTGLAGAGNVDWNLCDHLGSRVAAGLYFARLNANASCTTTRIVVVR
jgi:thiol-disulfide isomerase/thioredoxin